MQGLRVALDKALVIWGPDAEERTTGLDVEKISRDGQRDLMKYVFKEKGTSPWEFCLGGSGNDEKVECLRLSVEWLRDHGIHKALEEYEEGPLRTAGFHLLPTYKPE